MNAQKRQTIVIPMQVALILLGALNVNARLDTQGMGQHAQVNDIYCSSQSYCIGTHVQILIYVNESDGVKSHWTAILVF